MIVKSSGERGGFTLFAKKILNISRDKDRNKKLNSEGVQRNFGTNV